jgi:hypothetical protein
MADMLEQQQPSSPIATPSIVVTHWPAGTRRLDVQSGKRKPELQQ